MVRVSAAASLGPVLDALSPRLEAELGVTLRLNLAGSGTLVRQMLDGAPADAVILAHADWMRPLVEAGRVRADGVAELAGNGLVVVGRGGAVTLEQLAEPRFGRLAWGDPASVPAGRYTEQALRSAGVWDAVRSRGVTTADVRAALRYAEAGEVEAAVVYASDAVGLALATTTRTEAEAVAVLCVIDPSKHDPIVIVGAAIDEADLGQRVLAWLQNEAAQHAFATQGFTRR